MSISIGNQNLYSSMAAITASKGEAALEDKLKNTTSLEDKELMDVCKSFETYFVEQVFKEMRKTVPESEEKNEYMDYFGDMLYEEYSKEITKNDGMGIAQMLYESMKRNS